MTRKEITKLITASVALYLAKKGYSVHLEVGIEPKRNRSKRVDIYGLNYKLNTVIVEVKSCIQDFRSDSKWQKYILYGNKMYFAFIKDTYTKLTSGEIKILKELGIGILLVDIDFYKSTRYECVSCRKRAKTLEVDKDIAMFMLKKIAFKSGLHKGNANTKQYDIYEQQSTEKIKRKGRLRRKRKLKREI